MKVFTRLAHWSLGLVGAAAGGILGYFIFFWMARQGFYALVLPGAALGLGCALLSGRKSYGLGIVCGLLGVVLGLLTEWRFAPFVADGSFSFFLAHLGDLRPFTLAAIGIGGVFAFWLGMGNVRLLPRHGREARPCEHGKDNAGAELPQSPATRDHLR